MNTTAAQQDTITLCIVPGQPGQPPMVRVSATDTDGHGHLVRSALNSGGETAMVALAMLGSAAYLFAQGQPVKFGPEVPLEVLK